MANKKYNNTEFVLIIIKTIIKINNFNYRYPLNPALFVKSRFIGKR